MPYQNQEVISTVLYNLQSKIAEGKRVTVTAVLFALRDLIVEEYVVGSPLQIYKDRWVTRIKGTAKEYNVELSASSPSWIRLDPLLLNKSSENTAASTTSHSPSPSRTPSASTRRTGSTTASTSSSSSSSNTALSYFLTAEDKDLIKNVYENLDPSKMWKLSTGTIVEKQMEELANKCIVEHPCHSLIMDADDETWVDYFTEEELDEIRDHKPVELIPPPSELKEYLDHLVQKEDADEMHEDISQIYYKPKVNPACYWAQKTLLNGLDLHHSGFFRSLSDHSERDFVTRVWSMMLTTFDYSRIMAREEIYSAACSMEMNQSRRLGSTAALAKKRFSKRPDHLYSFNEYELGILEAAKKSDENGNKEYKDALLKSPKTMKDMLLQATKYDPSLLHSIKIPCFITSALDVKLLILDSPEGYVCRISSTKPYKYPSSLSTFIKDIIPCLELGWLNKSIMEETVDALIAPVRSTVALKRKRSSGIPSCFVRGAKKPASNVSLHADTTTS